jgi:hypothetical protein
MQKVGESGMKKPIACLVEVSYEQNCGTFHLIQKWDCGIFMGSSMFVCIHISIYIYIYTHIYIFGTILCAKPHYCELTALAELRWLQVRTAAKQQDQTVFFW